MSSWCNLLQSNRNIQTTEHKEDTFGADYVVDKYKYVCEQGKSSTNFSPIGHDIVYITIRPIAEKMNYILFASVSP